MKIFRISVAVIAVLAVAALAGYHLFFKLSVPEYTGTINLKGIESGVRVKTDTHGVPHIFAENETDLFFAQGFITARERMFQMDMTRMAGRGELSSIFGEMTLDKDKFLKTLGVYRQARKSYQALSPDSKAILKAFSEGVNAYIDTAGHLPREYVFLKTKPRKWVPEDSVATILLMSYSLTRSKKVDLIMHQIREHAGDVVVKAVMPSYPEFAPVLAPRDGGKKDRASLAIRNCSVPGFAATATGPSHITEPVDVFPLSLDIAASNWMIFSPRMTKSGKALFAGSPDLSPTLPGLFYILHLKGGDIDAMGGTLPGVPGIGPLGFNGHIVWSMVNGRGDELDYFVEKINPDNPDQYLTENGYKDFQIIEETLKIKTGDGIREEKFKVRISRHGPMISGVMPFAPENCAMQWTALDLLSRDFEGLVGLNKARSFEDFRKASSLVRTMNLNIGYADADGNIGWQFTAAPPIRKQGNGSMPVPGWTGEYDWKGFVPFEDLPWDYNPERGYVASFNNDPGNVDYYLTNYYLFERAIRFAEIMKTRPKKPVDLAELKSMQLDKISVVAQRWTPIILAACESNQDLMANAGLLRDWDCSIDTDSSAATLFNYFYYLMMKNTLMDDVGEKWWEDGLAQEYLYYIPELALTRIKDDNKNPLYDDKTTADVIETRDDIIQKSMKQAVEYLTNTLGRDVAKWKWGKVHKMVFQHPLGQKLFFLNLAPIPAPGSHHTINSGFWTPKQPFKMTSGGVIRMMVDFADLENSTIISPPGQSGHFKSPYYDDLALTWARGDQIPMNYLTAEQLPEELLLLPESDN